MCYHFFYRLIQSLFIFILWLHQSKENIEHPKPSSFSSNIHLRGRRLVMAQSFIWSSGSTQSSARSSGGSCRSALVIDYFESSLIIWTAVGIKEKRSDVEILPVKSVILSPYRLSGCSSPESVVCWGVCSVLSLTKEYNGTSNLDVGSTIDIVYNKVSFS